MLQYITYMDPMGYMILQSSHGLQHWKQWWEVLQHVAAPYRRVYQLCSFSAFSAFRAAVAAFQYQSEDRAPCNKDSHSCAPKFHWWPLSIQVLGPWMSSGLGPNSGKVSGWFYWKGDRQCSSCPSTSLRIQTESQKVTYRAWHIHIYMYIIIYIYIY